MNGTNQIPFLISEVGSCWGNNPLIHNKNTNSEEVTIIGIGLENTNLVIGECKWKKSEININIALKLIKRSNFFPYSNKLLIIFSKSAFTEELIKYASENKIRLLTFSEMITSFKDIFNKK